MENQVNKIQEAEMKLERNRIIKEKTQELAKKYPMENMYNSRCTLWRRGLKDGSVSEELFNEASEYYSYLWNYVGD